MKFEIVTIGSAVLDILIKSKAFTITNVHEAMMVCQMYGGKMDVEEAVLASGGAATNTAVSFARQGFVTAALCEIGVDIGAQIIWDDLHREGVHTRLLVQEKGERTGISAVLISGEGLRSAMTFRGAAHQLEVKDIDFTKLTTLRAIHLSSVGNYDLIRKVSAHCAEHNIFLSWNPSKTEARELFLQQGLGGKKFCDVLFLNGSEWEVVLKAKEQVLSVSPLVIVTEGSKGGNILAHGKSVPFSAKAVPVVDETGAGDAFASGFTGAILRGAKQEEAIAFGVENSASVVGSMGAKSGLLRI